MHLYTYIILFGLQKAFNIPLNFNYKGPLYRALSYNYRGAKCLQVKHYDAGYPSLPFKFSLYGRDNWSSILDVNKVSKFCAQNSNSTNWKLHREKMSYI